MVWMVLSKYFQLKNRKQPLPDSNGVLSVKIPCSAISFANVCVGKLLNSMADSFSDDDKCNANLRGPHTILTPAQKFEIGKRAAEVWSTAAMRCYAKNYPAVELKETSVRRFKNNYQIQLKTSTKEGADISTVQELVSKKCGHPLLVGEELDEQVREYVRELRLSLMLIRAGLSILGALGKFNSSGPSRVIHAEAIVHYSTVCKQFINSYSTVYACKYSINIVCKKHSKLLLLVYIVVSAGYSMCYHITMKVCLEL